MIENRNKIHFLLPVFLVLVLMSGSRVLIEGQFRRPPEAKHASTNLRKVQVLFKSVPDPEDIQRVKRTIKLERLDAFDRYPSKFFSRLFETEASKSQIEAIKRLSLIEGIHIPQVVSLMAVTPTKVASDVTNDTLRSYQWALENVYRAGDENVDEDPNLARGHLLLREINDQKNEFVSSKPADGSEKTYSIEMGPRSLELAEALSLDSKKVEPAPISERSRPIRRQCPAEPEKKFAREDGTITVAVIDSGVDYSHRDLKDNMWFNEAECVQDLFRGLSPGASRADRDCNSYQGDCVGWNFAVPTNHPARNKPKDTVSHGTHVAGIIAAKRNNEYGVSGVSDRIRIMALKVIGTSQKERDDIPDDPGEFIGFTDAIAKAVRYATHNGAGVINMSLGWPRIADVDIVREAIREANEAGVVVVAAAGNDGHSSLIMPCGLQGVICVGSINNDGTVSSFSNHGGHVDLLAPGLGIISTFPSDDPSLSPSVWPAGNFEIKAGTSQAAPYVSAAAAVLKSDNPNASSDEILARLMISSRPVYSKMEGTKLGYEVNSQAQAGAIQLESALNLNRIGIAYLNFKDDVSLVEFESESLSGSTQIEVKSLWDSSEQVEISVSSLNKGVVLTKSFFQLGDIEVGTSTTVKLDLVANSLDVDSMIPIEFEITQKGLGKRKVWHQLMFSRSLRTDDLISATIKPLSEQSVGLRHIKTLRGQEPEPTFYDLELFEDRAQISVLKYQDGQVKKLGPAVAPDLHRRFSAKESVQDALYTLDLNADGKFDYLLIARVQDAQATNFYQLSYFDHDLKPMYGEHSHFRFPENAVIPNWTKPSFINQRVAGLGLVKVPVFHTRGVVPDVDKRVNFSDSTPEYQEAVGVFYLDVIKDNDGSYQFSQRYFDNRLFGERLREKLEIRNVDRLLLMQALPQSTTDYERGVVKLLYHFDSIGKHRVAVVEVSRRAISSRLPMSVKIMRDPMDLRDVLVSPVIDLSGGQVKVGNTHSFYELFYSNKMQAKFLTNDGLGLRDRVRYISKSRSGLVRKDKISPASFLRSGEIISVFQTGRNIVGLVKKSGKKQTSFERTVVRSTLLPGWFFSELLYPTVVKSGSSFNPAMFVDSTSVLAGNIMVWEVSGAGARVPVRFNLRIPDTCLTVDRAKWDSSGTQAAVLHCEDIETGENTLRFLPFSRHTQSD